MDCEPLALYRALVIKADEDGYWEGTREEMARICNYPLVEIDDALLHLLEWHKVMPIGTSLFGDERCKWFVAR